MVLNSDIVLVILLINMIGPGVFKYHITYDVYTMGKYFLQC